MKRKKWIGKGECALEVVCEVKNFNLECKKG